MQLLSIKTILKTTPFLISIALWLSLFLLSSLGVFSALDLKFTDHLLQQRGSIAASDKVVVVGIGEESFDAIDEPIVLWNGRFAKALRALAGAGAEVIGFDLIQNKAFSGLLAERNQELINAVIEIQEESQTRLVFATVPDKQLYPFEMLNLALAEYGSLGYANLTLDQDDIVRRQMLCWSADDAIVPSFALLSAARYLKQEISYESGTLSIGDQRVINSSDAPVTMLINFAGAEEAFRIYSFLQLIEKAEQADTAWLRSIFSDKIVLIGLVTLDDMHNVSFRISDDATSQMTGVLIHANTIDTILRSDYLKELSPFRLAGIPFLSGLILLMLAFRKTGVFTGAVITLSLLLAGYWGCNLLFRHLNLVFFYPSAAAGVLFLPLLLYTSSYISEKHEKDRVRSIFSAYLNPYVLEDLLSRENSFIFKMDRKKIAIMFSDVRDFTTISSYLEPDEVAVLLNEYCTAMFEAIFQHKGTLHLYIGDGIMALWGAPVADDDCCLNALRGSLKMLENLKPLNEKWDKDSRLKAIAKELGRDKLFRIGIGLHYSDPVVGYMGPPQRMQYTAIGDGVNTASRVEGLNKEFGSELLMTVDFYAKVKQHINAESLGLAKIKGRDPIEVYKLVDVAQTIRE